MIRINGKMTCTFNPESYGKLLAEYQPKTITTEEENEQAIALALTLEHRPNRTPEEEILLELLVTLIEKFEQTHYPIPQGTPHSMLMHLIDARDITPEALAEVIGSLEVVREIVNLSLDDIGEILIKVRIAKKITEKELAALTRLTEEQIIKYENKDYQNASFDTVRQVANALGIKLQHCIVISDINDFLNGQLMEVRQSENVDAEIKAVS